MPTGSENEPPLPPTESNSDDHTTTAGLVTSGDGVLLTTGNSGDAALGTGVSTDGDGSAGLVTGGIDGCGPEDMESAGDDSELSEVVNASEYHWPIVYVRNEILGMTYLGNMPEGAETIVVIDGSHSVDDVIELARFYGFSAKSILNHMVDCGYQFRTQDDLNMFTALDY